MAGFQTQIGLGLAHEPITATSSTEPHEAHLERTRYAPRHKATANRPQRTNRIATLLKRGGAAHRARDLASSKRRFRKEPPFAMVQCERYRRVRDSPAPHAVTAA